MPTTIEVRFKGNRKDYFLWPDEAEPLHLREAVVVEAERGLDFGRVGLVGEGATKKCAAGCSGCASGTSPTAQLAVVRLASQEDIKAANDLRRSEEETRIRAIERVRHYNLEMRVSNAEWQWDKKKLTLYFTAEKRIDFRDLVRDLASTFKTRIELRQIGVRDEAARLGGLGRCGKEFCCSTWLRELTPISLSLAKDQHLSLNPSQISGGCGRLLCCLKYEHEFYVAARKRFPKEGKAIRTRLGSEKVVAVDIFRERLFLRHEVHGPRVVGLLELKEELALIPDAAPIAPVPPVRTVVKPVAPPSAPAPAAPAAPPPQPSHRPPQASQTPSDPAGADADAKKRAKRRRRRRRGPRPGDSGSPPSGD